MTASLLDLLHPVTRCSWSATTITFVRAARGRFTSVLKTDGTMQARVRRWVRPLMIAFIIAYAITTLATLLYQPHMIDRIQIGGRGCSCHPDRHRAGRRQYPTRDLPRPGVPRIPLVVSDDRAV